MGDGRLALAKTMFAGAGVRGVGRLLLLAILRPSSEGRFSALTPQKDVFLRVWQYVGYRLVVQRNSCQMSKSDKRLELLIRRGLLGFKNVAEASLLLFDQTDGYVDASLSRDLDIARV